jgi:hypothetical protein
LFLKSIFCFKEQELACHRELQLCYVLAFRFFLVFCLGEESFFFCPVGLKRGDGEREGVCVG